MCPRVYWNETDWNEYDIITVMPSGWLKAIPVEGATRPEHYPPHRVHEIVGEVQHHKGGGEGR